MARYCGYCGRKGHNRRTCPHRTEEQKQADKTWHSKPGPRSGSKSICSYCGEAGHNRRTCWHLKHRTSQAEGFIEGAVAFAIQQYKAYGLGAGALYEREDSWTNQKSTYLITDGLSVAYHEQVIRNGDGSWHEDLETVPAFTFNIMGSKVFGDRPVERDIGPKVIIYNDLKNNQTVSQTRYLQQFALEKEGNKMVGKTDHPYSEKIVQRLREWAHREVKEFFRKKENRHPKFGEETELWAIRAEAEAQEKMKG